MDRSVDALTRYDEDVFAWSREQADVLRTLLARPGLPNGLDLPNVIEEIEDVGNNQLHAVESCIRLILVHLIKVVSSRSPEPKRHWLAEIVSFHADLMQRYTPSMRQAVDLDRLWRRALKQSSASLEAEGEEVVLDMRSACPVHLDQLTSEELDRAQLVAQVEAASASHA